MMKISPNGIKFIKEKEGTRSAMYKDSAGYPTIGVGHLLTKSELSSGKIVIGGNPVLWRNGLSDSQINELLDQDLDRFEKAVNDFVTVPLTQNQFDTLVSFSFNVGVGALKGSSLLKVLNNKQYATIPGKLNSWVYAGGKVDKGLINRRAAEGKLWLA